MSRTRACDAILAATIFAALLLLPPILPFFDRPEPLFGMPLIVVYVFGVWIAVIGIGWSLSKRLPADIPPGQPTYPAAKEGP